MSDKLRLVLQAALVAVLALWWWLGGRTPEQAQHRNFRAQVLQVDTGALRTFTLTPPLARGGTPLTFRREPGGWTATAEGHSTPAFAKPLNALLAALVDMRPVAMPGPAPATLERYGLTDSLAGMVQLPGMAAALRIGTTTSGEDPATAVLVPGDPNAYLVPGSFTWITDLDFPGWIPKPMVNGDPANWRRITFTFPGNRSYSMVRAAGGWAVNGQPADSLKVAKYLHALSRYYGSGLANPADTLHARLIYQLEVEDRTRSTPVFLGIFQAGDHLIARSTLAPRWLVMPFDAQEELPRMFRAPEAFWPGQGGG